MSLFLIFTFSLSSFALDIPGYEGGIQNEMFYREVIFITGEPILLTGTIDIRTTVRNNVVTERYTYRLENIEKEAKMTRNATITKTITNNGKQQQEVFAVTNFKEVIDIGPLKFETDQKSSQWSKSNIHEIKPGVTYFAGNWDGRKNYTINRNEGNVMVETKGSTVGYQQHWGTTETQTLQHFIQYDGRGDDPLKWQGTATVEAVHNRTLDYAYEANAPSQISFRGGYLLTEQQENVLKYTYDLPRFSADGNLLSQRNLGSNSFSLDTNPVNKRLNIPHMRDIEGHWAESNVLLLASLEAVYPNSSYFGPSLPMTRGDFARAVAVIMGVELEEEPQRQRSIQAQQQEAGVFLDVSRQDPNHKYIKAVKEKGIMVGLGQDLFLPNQTLTKAEATTIIVRLLGFENLAPIQRYNTGFRDDANIPLWAKDSVYVARELSLVSGTNDGYFQPQKPLTKAEATTLLTNLIHYLQRELRYDYRERILNY